jgi:hypothetical protein
VIKSIKKKVTILSKREGRKRKKGEKKIRKEKTGLTNSELSAKLRWMFFIFL